MKYTKVSFSIEPNSQIIQEILTAELAEFAFDSFEETPTGLDAYIPTKDYKTTEIDSLQAFSIPDYQIKYTIEELPDQNWNETWEKNYFSPIIIDNRCIVKSPFHTDVPSAEYEILIEPKMAFGTGHHETTGLMIKHILETDFTGKNVLDMGCGTGILGILASKKNASHIDAIDIEDWSYHNAIENAETNKVSNLSAFCGDASLLKESKKYDIILANINRNILLEDINKYSLSLKNNGLLILSGFYNQDIEIIDKECNKYNLSKITIKEDNHWVAVSYRKVK